MPLTRLPRLLKVTLAAAALSACGPGPVCVTPTLRLQVHGPLLRSTCDDYEALAHAFYVTVPAATHVDRRFADIDASVAGTNVFLKDEPWSCDAKGVCLSGQAYCHLHSIDAFEESHPLHSVLIHELIHIAQGCRAWPEEGPDEDDKRGGHEGWNRHGVWKLIGYAKGAIPL